MAEIEFTSAWKDHEKAEMRLKLEEVFQYFPEFDGKKVKIGRTQANNKRGVFPAEANLNDRRYLRVRPSASKHTISHELIHVLTREKATDILSLARSPSLIDDSVNYLNIEEKVARNNRIEIWKLAREAEERFNSHEQIIDWFEKKLEEKDIPTSEEVERSVF